MKKGGRGAGRGTWSQFPAFTYPTPVDAGRLEPREILFTRGMLVYLGLP